MKEAVALVTGGASGLGKATVQHLLKHGFKVAMLDLPSSNGSFLTKLINRNCLYVSANVNVFGTLNVVRHALDLVAQNEKDESGYRGIIINTTSFSSFEPQFGQATVCCGFDAMSSGAMNSATLALAKDHASDGIRFVAIAPGIFRTPLVVSNMNEMNVEIYEKMVELPARLGIPEEFAALVLHLGNRIFIPLELNLRFVGPRPSRNRDGPHILLGCELYGFCMEFDPFNRQFMTRQGQIQNHPSILHELFSRDLWLQEVADSANMRTVWYKSWPHGIVALVTGAASGLGAGTARHLLEHGAKVVIMDLPRSKGETLAKEMGQNCLFTAADVRSSAEVSGAFHALIEKFGQLDAVVNCAGVSYPFKLYNLQKKKTCDAELIRETFDVNVFGTFNVIQQALETFALKSKDDLGFRGVIVNTASIAAYDGQVGQSVYAASKGAIVSATLAFARDYAEDGIRFMTIAPGLFDTPLMSGLPEKVRTFLADMIPLPNRLGSPEEFGALVRHIIENRYLNGEVIRLDGGLRMPP
uniref:3-hydroxyacyl-CoA dehydrogenase type-2 n=1 Tax=Elaeophora elaphi TaxID=1147741 RepID=A0A0R3RS58_9BILA